jgi:FkbM family methyltransferase
MPCAGNRTMRKLEWYEWNPFMFNKLSPIIRDKWTFADIGANHGEFTDFFKTTGYEKIYAFELNPGVANLLKEKYNGIPNIIIENYAVCNKNGTVPFFNGGKDAGDTCYNIIGHNMHFENTDNIGTVPSIRLDTYFKEIRINLMKIDVEGAEISVLEGLKSISSNVDYILLECHVDSEWDRLRCLLLDEFNLHCINFYDDSVITKDSSRPYQCFCERKA